MFKKCIAVLLCSILLLSLAACGENGNGYEETVTPTGEAESSDEPGTENSGESETQTQTAPQTVKVTVPEGYTLVRISWLLEEKGVCASADFIEAAQSFDLSQRPMLSDVKAAKNVCFPLEGYLFPATYTFQKDSSPKTVLNKMLDALGARLTDGLRQEAGRRGRSLHEILTIASIIEKEAFTDGQRTAVSAVIYNRLSKKMKLQCDVTIKYCTGVIGPQYPEKLDHYKHYYNTYRCEALPAGPICCPGLASIRAALCPDDSDAIFFVIDPKPPHEARFAATYEEHKKNCKKMGF